MTDHVSTKVEELKKARDSALRAAAAAGRVRQAAADAQWTAGLQAWEAEDALAAFEEQND